MRRLVTLFFIASALIFSTLAFSYPKTPFDFPVKKITVEGKQLRVLVADTEFRRQQGLSYVELSDLKKNNVDGMLFVFDDNTTKTFQAWYMKFDIQLIELMKNTKNNSFSILEKKQLKVGTLEKVKGFYILEIVKF